MLGGEEGGLIWIVGAEAEDEVSVWADEDGVAPHGDFGEGFVIDEVAGVLGGADDCLEGVAVEVEGMTAGVIVVEDDFDDLVFLENESVGVDAVDGGVGCGDAGG